MTVAEIITNLKGIVGEERVVSQEGKHLLGNNGDVKVFPQTEEEICRIVKFANDSGKKIVVAGGETKRGFGGLIESSDLILSLSEYKGIVEHTVGDMTITVKAGTPYKELQNYLATHNQMIALDAKWMEKATIGGIIATNDCGPKRLGYGSARDSVIGMRLVYPDGRIIRAGGKVVKNVAGYDMNKLFIGSMGTLAVLSEVTLKLRPLAKSEKLTLVSSHEQNLSDIRLLATQILDSTLEPISLELLNVQMSERLTGEKKYTLAIGFEDVESSVNFQVDMLHKMKPDTCQIRVYQQKEAQSFWENISTSGPNGINPINQTALQATLKIGIKNLDVLPVIKKMEELQSAYHINIDAHGGLGHGIGFAYMKGENENVVKAIVDLREFVKGLGGYVVITHLPYVQRQKIQVYGDKPSHFFLLEGIKSKVDPNNVLNYKRFVGGI